MTITDAAAALCRAARNFGKAIESVDILDPAQQPYVADIVAKAVALQESIDALLARDEQQQKHPH